MCNSMCPVHNTLTYSCTVLQSFTTHTHTTPCTQTHTHTHTPPCTQTHHYTHTHTHHARKHTTTQTHTPTATHSHIPLHTQLCTHTHYYTHTHTHRHARKNRSMASRRRNFNLVPLATPTH